MAEKFTQLAQLESLRDALVSKAREQEQAATELRAREVETLRTVDEFRDAVGDVTPLNGHMNSRSTHFCTPTTSCRFVGPALAPTFCGNCAVASG